VEALNADSLKHFQLLIILRDGMNWPNGYDKEPVKWMTDAQQQAIWDFVNDGGGFLALHNAQGIYPPGGLILQAVRRRLRWPSRAVQVHGAG